MFPYSVGLLYDYLLHTRKHELLRVSVLNIKVVYYNYTCNKILNRETKWESQSIHHIKNWLKSEKAQTILELNYNNIRTWTRLYVGENSDLRASKLSVWENY